MPKMPGKPGPVSARQFSRRTILAGLLGATATAGFANPLDTSLRPRARSFLRPPPSASAPPMRATLDAFIEDAGLSGTVGVAIADADTGSLVEGANATVALPPASVTKALTALYALDALGGAYRFATRILATGPIVDGVLDGDLILAGGGDPTLSTDDLAELVAQLVQAGLQDVRGRFLCWGNALPYAEEIEPDQLDHLSYNPSVSGLNLNYNRVRFEWARNASGYDLTLDAKTSRYTPLVSTSRVRAVTRQTPVYIYEGADEWTVARGALGEGGFRWLPVRRPALYAGDVMRTLAAAEGLRLPQPEIVQTLGDGVEVARHESATLRQILRDMLYYSTNLTAEICGLAATAARQGAASDIASSADMMTRWLRRRYGVSVSFKDHSGLSDETRISAFEMVSVLVAEGPDSDLAQILKDIPMRDDERAVIADHPVEVQAKTGTLNFVSALAGFAKGPQGNDLAFAIFAADLPRRAQSKLVNDEIPPGSRTWNSRAKRLQQRILQRWGLTYRN